MGKTALRRGAPKSHYQIIFAILLFLFLISVLVWNAWIVDDAYITFRTVDNFVHGRGLVWNLNERVQVYTHPLWMFVVSLFYLITSELFFTVVTISLIFCLLSIFVVAKFSTQGFKKDHWKLYFLVLAFISSKSVLDYASSGLENCLSYLIVSLFLVKLLSFRHKNIDFQKDTVFSLFFLASLLFVNRYDLILLVLPALIYVVITASRQNSRWALSRTILIACSPAIVWVMFAIIYYGSPFPNTAFAKDFSTGFPFLWSIQRGLQYLFNSIAWDTCSYLLLGCCLFFAFKDRTQETTMSLAGIILYLIYVVLSAASATHMSGRFFAVPMFVVIFLFVVLVSNYRIGLISTFFLITYLLWCPISALKFGTHYYHAYKQVPSYIDTKWYVGNEGSALINWRPGKKMPDHSWYHAGEQFRKTSSKVHVGGAFGGVALGYFGFAAGPDPYIIDKVGLSDPLLSRLPAMKPDSMNDWYSGHFHRRIPEGYIESVTFNLNLITDPFLHEYYDKVRIVTRAPIFSIERFLVIFKMNTGQYHDLIRKYSDHS